MPRSPNQRLVAFRKLFDEVGCVGNGCGFMDAFFCDVIPTIGDVVADRGVEQQIFLSHYTEELSGSFLHPVPLGHSHPR